MWNVVANMFCDMPSAEPPIRKTCWISSARLCTWYYAQSWYRCWLRNNHDHCARGNKPHPGHTQGPSCRCFYWHFDLQAELAASCPCRDKIKLHIVLPLFLVWMPEMICNLLVLILSTCHPPIRCVFASTSNQASHVAHHHKDLDARIFSGSICLNSLHRSPESCSGFRASQVIRSAAACKAFVVLHLSNHSRHYTVRIFHFAEPVHAIDHSGHSVACYASWL